MGRGVAYDKEDARGCETGRPVIYTPPTRVCFKSFAPDGPVPLRTIDPARPPLRQVSASPPCSRPWPHLDASMFAIVDGDHAFQSGWSRGARSKKSSQKRAPDNFRYLVSLWMFMGSRYLWRSPRASFNLFWCSGDDIIYTGGSRWWRYGLSRCFFGRDG